jgi:hypothetical protein
MCWHNQNMWQDQFFGTLNCTKSMARAWTAVNGRKDGWGATPGRWIGSFLLATAFGTALRLTTSLKGLAANTVAHCPVFPRHCAQGSAYFITADHGPDGKTSLTLYTHSLSKLTKIVMCCQILLILSNIELHKNFASNSPLFIWKQANRQREANRYVMLSYIFANSVVEAPTNGSLQHKRANQSNP